MKSILSAALIVCAGVAVGLAAQADSGVLATYKHTLVQIRV